MTVINVEPLVIEKIGNITFSIVKAEIAVTQVELFEKARIMTSLKDENDVIRAVYEFEISDEEYNQWNNDTYIVELVKSKIGLVEVVSE